MFGCLRKFIFLIIFIFAVIGFTTVGGVNFFKDLINKNQNNSQPKKIEKAYDIADFSKLNSEFEVVSTSKIPKIGSYVYVKHGISSQRFYFIKPSKQNLLTKQDFESQNAEKKIIDFVNNFKILKFENFEANGKGTMNGLGQKIPYIKFQADVAGLPLQRVQAIIGLAVNNNENIIIIVLNSYGKYSQIITNVLLDELK